MDLESIMFSSFILVVYAEREKVGGKGRSPQATRRCSSAELQFGIEAMFYVPVLMLYFHPKKSLCLLDVFLEADSVFLGSHVYASMSVSCGRCGTVTFHVSFS